MYIFNYFFSFVSVGVHRIYFMGLHLFSNHEYSSVGNLHTPREHHIRLPPAATMELSIIYSPTWVRRGPVNPPTLHRFKPATVPIGVVSALRAEINGSY